MSHVLALDQGTTSSRAIVFDDTGRLVAVARREFRQYYPQPGWVEHDPAEIWSSQCAVIAEVLAAARLTARDLSAVGITNQRETTLVWDRRTGAPIAPALVWQDRRTAPLCDALRAAGHEALFTARTGLLLDPYFSGTKVRWLLDQVPGARARAQRGELAFGTVDSWLIWNLSGGRLHVTDVTNASRTLLFNLRTGAWDQDLLQRLELPSSLLPEVCDSSGVVGEISALPALKGVPVAGVAGDQHAALFGQTCYRPGLAKNTYGTGCFLLMHTGDVPVMSSNRLLTTPAWRIGGRTDYALEGSVFIGGAVVQWLRDGLGLIRHSSDIEALAASVPDNGGVYFVPAFAGLGAPHWDAYARGSLQGLTRGVTAGHIARAALESMAFQSFDVLQAMERDAGLHLKELRVDGGACANNLLMQFQADLLQVPVVRPKVTETTALGAAYLAGLATGVWSSRDELAGHAGVDRIFEPQQPAVALEPLRAGWNKALHRSRAWAEGDGSSP
jgi:glycerol kinase